jgi:hypothetical protein
MPIISLLNPATTLMLITPDRNILRKRFSERLSKTSMMRFTCFACLVICTSAALIHLPQDNTILAQLEAELKGLRVRELKHRLRKLGVVPPGVAEKRELVHLLLEHQRKEVATQIRRAKQKQAKDAKDDESKDAAAAAIRAALTVLIAGAGVVFYVARDIAVDGATALMSMLKAQILAPVYWVSWRRRQLFAAARSGLFSAPVMVPLSLVSTGCGILDSLLRWAFIVRTVGRFGLRVMGGPSHWACSCASVWLVEPAGLLLSALLPTLPVKGLGLDLGPMCGMFAIQALQYQLDAFVDAACPDGGHHFENDNAREAQEEAERPHHGGRPGSYADPGLFAQQSSEPDQNSNMPDYDTVFPGGNESEEEVDCRDTDSGQDDDDDESSGDGSTEHMSDID